MKSATRRQSIVTLAFFCFFILIAVTSCSDNIFSTPNGNRSLEVDTLYYDHHDIISGVKNRNVNASGNQLLQNKAGHYRDLSAEFIIKFSNFIPLTGLPDSVELTINQASALFYIADYHGDESSFSLDISMVDNDSSLNWLNSSVPADVFSSIEGRTTPYSTTGFPVTSDSIFIPLDLDLVNDWHTRYDSLYVNNGFTVKKSDASEGMIAFHSADYVSTETDMRPRLVLECSLHDTNGVFLQDSIFYLAASADLQHTESTANMDDSLFYIARGNIFRAYLMMDSLRNDSLLGPTRLLNRALQTFVIDKDNSMIADNDTLYLTARLFKADHWETDSISYMYTTQSDIFTLADDSIHIDISQLIQYLVSNPKQMEYEGIFYYLQDEYNAFNSITIDPALSGLDIIYTKVRDE